MKKIILPIIGAILLMLLMISEVFAATQITLNSPREAYNIDDTIELSIIIESDSDNISEVSLEGIDNFQLMGKSQSQSTRNINGEITSVFEMRLSMLAREEGEYVIGPVKIDLIDEQVESEVLNVIVSGERIMVNNKIKNLPNNTPAKLNDKEEKDEDIRSVDLGSSEVNEKEEKIIPPVGLDGEVMTDIYPEKNTVFDYPFTKNSLYWLFYAFIALVLYLSLCRYLENNKVIPEEPVEEILVFKTQKDYQLLLTELEKLIPSEKKKFYEKAGYIIRLVITEKLGYTISHNSLREMRKVMQEEQYRGILFLYETIYFPEFNTMDDTTKTREEVIADLKKIIEEHTQSLENE